MSHCYSSPLFYFLLFISIKADIDNTVYWPDNKTIKRKEDAVQLVAIFCIDDYNGMMFNHRRQSKDKILIEDVIELCNGQNIYMSEYTKNLFLEHENKVGIITADSNFLQTAPKGSFCFVEDLNIYSYLDKLDKIIIYKWNRHYPADLFFDTSILKNWTLKDIVIFKGASHEKITREVYVK